MQVRRNHRGEAFELFHRGIEIGEIRGGVVTFTGFTTQADAALAASIAHHALRRRRARDEQLPPFAGPRSEATIRSHDSADGDAQWAIDIELSDDEMQDVFATSRARTMWAALRTAGLDRRMRQMDRALTTA